MRLKSELYKKEQFEIMNQLWDISHKVYHTEPMINKLTNHYGKININYIGLVDNLDKDMNFIMTKIMNQNTNITFKKLHL